jgi:hypothetical protein
MEAKVIKFWEDELREVFGKDTKKKLDLFIEFLEMPKKENEHNPNIVCDEILNAMEKYATIDMKPQTLLDGLLNTEQYLRILCSYVDNEKYLKMSHSNEFFSEMIKWVGDFQLKNDNSLGISCNNVEDSEKYEVPKKYWAVAYWARNKDAHDIIKVNSRWVVTIAFSILYVMISSTWKYKDMVRKIVDEQTIFELFNSNEYRRNIVKKYEGEQRQKTFVKMNSVAYHNQPISSGEEEVEDDVINVLNIMNGKDDDAHYLKLIGEAGIGKSRLMRHLEYLDAKEGKVLPIYVELHNLVDMATTPEKLIADSLGVDIDLCNRLLSSVETHIYLDGVNEMLCADKEKFYLCKRIDELSSNYPKAKILVSDRENSAVTVSNYIPAYLICKLNEDMRKQFIELNCSKELVPTVTQIVERNEEMISAVSTPIMLILLIQMVEKGNFDMKANTAKEIYTCYVKGLIEREVSEKGETRAKKIEYFLSALAIAGEPDHGELAYYEEAKVLREFKKCADTFGIAGVDMLELVELVTQMGFLKMEKGGDGYTFANKMLEDYFIEYALEKGMVDYE